MKHGESFAQRLRLLAHFALQPFVLRFEKNFVDERDNLAHIFFLHAPGRDDGRAQSNTAGDGRRLLIERHRVLVHRDPRRIEGAFRVFARDIF